jgi:hypothetical protein
MLRLEEAVSRRSASTNPVRVTLQLLSRDVIPVRLLTTCSPLFDTLLQSRRLRDVSPVRLLTARSPLSVRLEQ